MTYTVEGIRWVTTARARRILTELRGEYPSEAEYRADRSALREYLCHYFNEIGCQRELGDSISPIGGAEHGGKVLKVRWRRPGQGKSGALRLIAIAYCDDQELRIVLAAKRKDGVSQEDLREAVLDDGALGPTPKPTAPRR